MRAFTDNTNSCDGPTATGAQNYDETYTYSDGGNVLSRTGVGTYSYGDAAHVHAVTGTSDGSSFGYDTDGNMTTRNLAGEAAQTLTWDADQRLDQLVVAGGDTTDFLYDADGARVLRHTAGVSTSFYPAGGTEYRIPDGAAGEFVYYYSVGGSTVAYEDAGTLTWLWTDHLGSSTLTRTESGSRNVQRYTPWGELRSNANVTTDRHYTGQISDQQTGLAFYNARYYDPVVGRFISPDSIVPSAGDGQDYNRYGYVRNNPVKYTDPTGHCGGIPGASTAAICDAYFSPTASATSPNRSYVNAAPTSCGGPYDSCESVELSDTSGASGLCTAGQPGCETFAATEMSRTLLEACFRASVRSRLTTSCTRQPANS